MTQEAQCPPNVFDFANAQGQKLAGLIDNPAGERAPMRCSRIGSPAARTCTPPGALPKV